jgi:hypothetical protein
LASPSGRDPLPAEPQRRRPRANHGGDGDQAAGHHDPGRRHPQARRGRRLRAPSPQPSKDSSPTRSCAGAWARTAAGACLQRSKATAARPSYSESTSVGSSRRRPPVREDGRGWARSSDLSHVRHEEDGASGPDHWRRSGRASRPEESIHQFPYFWRGRGAAIHGTICALDTVRTRGVIRCE